VKSKQPLGLQLWTVRELCEENFFGTLDKIAAVGYRAVEPYEFYGADVRELARVLSDHGLAVPSSHVALDRLEEDLEKVMDEHEALGCELIVCPWLDEERRKDPQVFEKVGRTLAGVAEKLTARGFSLAYHNHDFEFTMARDPDGLERVLASGGKDVGSQLDVYWVAFGGVDPVDYIKGLGPRLRSVHLKDGDLTETGFTPVGRGKLDIAAIIAAARGLGVESFVETLPIHDLSCLYPVLLRRFCRNLPHPERRLCLTSSR